MKSYRLILTVLACIAMLAAFSSCKKDKKEVIMEKCKISTVAFGTDAAHFSYNGNGTISKIDLGSYGVQLFEYSSNTITINSSSTDGLFGYKKIITLNSDGLATNDRTENNESGTEWDNTAYEYNGKELIKSTYTSSYSSSSEVETYSWSGGNLVSGSSGAVVEYYLDKPWQAGDFINVFQMLQGYTTIKNKNLIKSSTEDGEITNITYEFDTDGKIISMTLNGATTYNIEYQCN